MSRIVRIASWKGTPRASVVFVHGLGGHVYNTWRRAADDDTFWPIWLARDIEGLAVYSLAYEAPASNWLGTSMPLQDRAANIFELLLTEPGLRTGPIVLVCHSLGGLVVKKVLLNLQQQAMRRPEAADFLQRVREVVFAATPHTGSAQATWLDRLRFLAWPSSVARVLVANDPALRDINVAYRGLADERRNSLRHQIFYETRGTPGGEIVDEGSADPGLPGDPPVPVDADHIDIVKPPDRSSLLYMRVRQFVERMPAVAESGEVEVFPLPAIRSDQPLNLVPKLVRVAALALVALIAFKGVQALITPPLDIGKIQAPLVDQLAEKDRQIREKDRQYAALINSINSQRTTPAPPGADQELKKTVVAIDEGAKVDSRYAQALELLKAGKPSEAEPLLKAVAEDKLKIAGNAKQQAERGNKDAAAAYRNLASIAAVSDPGRAREYYSKSAELDPDNVEGVIWNGWYQLQAGKLDAAQAAFERVLGIAGPQESHWVFWARSGLGDILVQRNDLSGALRSFQNGLAVMDELAKSNPGDVGWQRDLAVSFERIGTTQMMQNDPPGALASFRDGLAIVEKLAGSDPGNADAQRDLALFFIELGDVQLAQGDLAGALKNYREQLAISDRLAKSDPGNVMWQRDLLGSFERIGNVLVRQNEPSGALKNYRDGFAIADKLAKSDSGNASAQRDVALLLARIGDAQKAQADVAGALRSYRDGLAISDRLVKSDPGNAIWQRDLSSLLEKTGDAQMAQDDLPGALRSYTDRLAVADRQAKSDPGKADWQRDLIVYSVKIGEVQDKQGNRSDALAAYRNGRVIADRLAKSDPGNGEWERDLAMLLDKIAEAQVAQGDLPGALGSYNEFLAIADRLAKSDPDNAVLQRDLAVSLFKVGIVLKAQNNRTKALETLRRARNIMSRVTTLAPDNTAWKKELGMFDKQREDTKR
jgi:tetratricopeptide (TPR) repeat protein